MKRWFWAIDALVVALFVVIGREDHGFSSTLGDYVRVATPLLIGLGVTTVAVRAWRTPTSLLTGTLLAAGTVAIGMVLRHFVWDDGTARTFIIVTSGFMLAGMVGWRLVAIAVEAFLDRRRPSTT